MKVLHNQGYHQQPVITANVVREKAVAWAKDILSNPTNFVILDTETTGLGSNAEVIQIGLIDAAGNVLVDNQLIKPTVEIDEGAERVHRISNNMVGEAPTFAEFLPRLLEIINGRRIIIYNAHFDIRVLDQSARVHDVQFSTGDVHCAMIQYANFMQVPNANPRRQGFRWLPLEGGDHSALGDCKAVLELLKRMGSIA